MTLQEIIDLKFAEVEKRLKALENYTGMNITDWKDGERYRFVGDTKVYRSYADYVDD